MVLIFLFFAFSAFSASIELDDGSKISGMRIFFDGEEFDIEGKNVDRESAKRLLVSAVKSDLFDINLSMDLEDSTLANYRRIAEEMEEEYPDASGLTIRFYEHRLITSDYRDVSYVHSVRKVLKPKRRNWATQSFYVVDGENHISILAARSIDGEGNVYDLDPMSVVVSEPARSGAFYGKGKNVSFTIPNVEEGSIIELVYVNEYYAPEDPNLLRVNYYFQGDEPSKFDRLDVEIPKERRLYYISQHLDDYYKTNFVTNIEGSPIPPSEVENPTEAKITETDSSRIYSWQMEDIEPFMGEPDMPDKADVVPRVEAGFYPNFDYFNEKYSQLYLEHMKATPELDSLAWAVVGEAKTDKEKTEKLYHWVQRNIRYISIKGALASSKAGHYAQITYDNRYGDCTDKAVLFATLLRIVGVEAYPISLRTNDEGFVDRGVFPSLRTNHCINEVWWDGEPHVLDATGSNMRFPYYNRGDCDIWYCNYIRGETVYNPPFPPEDNLFAVYRRVNITEAGTARSIDSLYFTGTMESWYRGFFERNPQENRIQYLEKRANDLKPGSVVKDYRAYNIEEISSPFSFAFVYTTQSYLTTVGDYRLLSSGVGYSFPEIALDERRYPIKISMPRQTSNRIEFDFPHAIFSLPESIDIDNQYFSYIGEWKRTGDGILFEDTFKRKKIRIPVKDYKDYKADAEKVLEFARQRVFLVDP